MALVPRRTSIGSSATPASSGGCFSSSLTLPHALMLRIELLEIQPTVYRQVIVPASITLPKLHQVIQAAMGWTDSHLHEFGIGGMRYGTPDPFDDESPESEHRVRLSKTLGQAKVFSYTYDFGDGWKHRVAVEDTLPIDPASKHSICTGGAQSCPPEDVGGPLGYIISCKRFQIGPIPNTRPCASGMAASLTLAPLMSRSRTDGCDA